MHYLQRELEKNSKVGVTHLAVFGLSANDSRRYVSVVLNFAVQLPNAVCNPITRMDNLFEFYVNFVAICILSVLPVRMPHKYLRRSCRLPYYLWLLILIISVKKNVWVSMSSWMISGGSVWVDLSQSLGSENIYCYLFKPMTPLKCAEKIWWPESILGFLDYRIELSVDCQSN